MTLPGLIGVYCHGGAGDFPGGAARRITVSSSTPTSTHSKNVLRARAAPHRRWIIPTPMPGRRRPPSHSQWSCQPCPPRQPPHGPRSGKWSTAWRLSINAPFTLVGGENVILVTGSMDATGLLDGGYDLCPQAFASVTARRGFAAMVPSPADLPPCLRFALRDYRSWRKHRQRRLTRSPCPNPWPPGRSREATRVAARRRRIGGP
jgi:hypothetical protein